MSGERRADLEGVRIYTKQQHILAPIPGTVRFAESFYSYGNTMIIEPQAGYLLVISGMDEMVFSEGDVISQGDVIGYFASNINDLKENPTLLLENRDRGLYVELRRNGQAQNLEEYFANSN